MNVIEREGNNTKADASILKFYLETLLALRSDPLFSAYEHQLPWALFLLNGTCNFSFKDSPYATAALWTIEAGTWRCLAMCVLSPYALYNQ